MKYYSVILSFHLISIIIWVSSLVYLQRLVLLQTNIKNKVLSDEAFFIYKRFANISFLTTVIFGCLLIVFNKSLLESGFWIYLKFFFISLIMIIHHLCKINLKQLENNIFVSSKKNIIWHSYAPHILVAIVTILTITKPF